MVSEATSNGVNRYVRVLCTPILANEEGSPSRCYPSNLMLSGNARNVNEKGSGKQRPNRRNPCVPEPHDGGCVLACSSLTAPPYRRPDSAEIPLPWNGLDSSNPECAAYWMLIGRCGGSILTDRLQHQVLRQQLRQNIGTGGLGRRVENISGYACPSQRSELVRDRLVFVRPVRP